MSRLASILYLAASIAAANAVSSVPIATQPLLSTATVSATANALSTSLSTFVSTETVVLYSTYTSRQRVVTSSVGQQLSIITSTSAIVAAGTGAGLSTIVSTIGLTTIYSIESSIESSTTSALPTSTSSSSTTSIIPPAVIPTTSSALPPTTPINIITSTASVSFYSTSLSSTSTAPALATSTTTSSSTSSPKSSSKKLSSGAVAGIAIGVIVLIAAAIGALFLILGKRRRQQKWGRKGESDSPGGESKTNLFSPDARAGYDSMWKKPAVGVAGVAVSEKEIRPGTATTTEARVSPVSHERGDSSTLGMDAPSIATASGMGTPKTDVFGDKPTRSSAPWRTVPNFSTPDRRSESITALPKM